MKKKFWNSKRMLALLLSLSLTLGSTGGVSAVTVSDNSIEPQTTVSANTTEEPAPEKAYNGTPSKVIGLRCETTAVNSMELMWNSLSTENKYLTSDGKLIEIGYQVEENGEIVGGSYESADEKYEFRPYNYYYTNLEVTPGKQFKYRVRGLYYVADTDVTPTQRKVIAVGEWSDYYTYTAPTLKEMPMVTGLKAEAVTDSYGYKNIVFTWNSVPQYYYYYVQYMYSDTKLTGLTDATWDEFYNKKGDAYTAFVNANPSALLKKSNTTSYNAPRASISYKEDYVYYYARVKTVGYVDGYESSSKYTSIVFCDASKFLKKTGVSVEQVKDFRVEYDVRQKDITFKWTPVDSNLSMYIFAYEQPTFPQYYYYNILNAKGRPVGSTGTSANYYFSSYMDRALKKTIDKKVMKIGVSGSSGSYTMNGFEFEPEKTYYFVAHTYDTSNSNVDRTPIFTIDGISYVRYADVSKPSAVISAKRKMTKPIVSTESAKTAITLYMQEDRSSSAYSYSQAKYEGRDHTGYEIYRKSGKKYKKIATTTDSFYKDSDLKKSSKYQYKVRAYYYDKTTKKKTYSDYTYVTGETCEIKSIDLVVKHKSKKAVSLKWTKVKGAVKYEIYRTSDDDGNPLEYAKSNTADKSISSAALSEKYTLLKTITKASKTSYVDKTVTPGTYYNYVVVAYYKVGKTTYQVQDSYDISMMLSMPKIKGNVSGTTAKYTWDKNQYAAGYEVKYLVYDKYRYAIGDYKTVKTTQNSFSVSVPQGGYVVASVRAYSASQCYSSWTSSSYVYCGLPVVTGIKAKKAGNGVQITWNPVAGAKYYKVYRGTKLNAYEKDTKSYLVEDDITPYIAKESNDDELYNESYYQQYYGETGSVVGTSAYDYAQLDSGVKYYYYVVAFGDTDSYVYSLASNKGSAYGSGKPASITLKSSIKITKITNKKKGQAVVKWSKLSGGKKYYVYRSNKKKGGYKLIATTKKNTYTDKKLKKGKTYYYKIVAVGTNPLKADYTVISSVKRIKIKK